MYIKIILFLFLFQKIYSISQTDSEAYKVDSNSNDNSGRNPNNDCPCDKSEVCDKGCCCDTDCLVYMLDHNYYEQYSECDPDSYLSRRTYSKLDYCDGYKKSIDDLYNPLVLAFKILKMGFCLYKTREDENDDDNENKKEYEKLKQKLESLEETDESELLKDYKINVTSANDTKGIGDFDYMKFYVPISLPSGLCFLGIHLIKKFQDYEVTCSYRINDNFKNEIIKLFPPTKKIDLKNYYYEGKETNEPSNTTNTDNLSDKIEFSSSIRNLADSNKIIKKVEINYYNENENETEIIHYLEDIDDKVYEDFTLDIKFLKDKKDYIKSGNPGYIKGKPILIGKKKDNYYSKYKYDITFPIKIADNDCKNNEIKEIVFYFDNYMDNKLTFDDYIFYGYKIEQDCYRGILNDCFKNEDFSSFGRFGNANIKYAKDWEEIKIPENSNNDYPFLIMGVYRDTGATNNTQFQLIDFEVNKNNNINKKFLYFIVKLLKLKNVKTKWWEAPGPGFIRLPRNIMYPFRIGTTDYK